MYICLMIFMNNFESIFLKLVFSVILSSLTYAIVVLALKHETALLLLDGINKKLKSRK